MNRMENLRNCKYIYIFVFCQIPFQGFPRDSNRYNIRKQLRVTGSGGLTFNTTQTYGVFFNTKGFSIYVQTDKGVYKPSQTGEMRDALHAALVSCS